MTRPAWDTLTPEQQRVEWARFHAWQAANARPAQAAVARPPRAPSPGRPRSRNPMPWLVGAAAGVVALIAVPVIASVAVPGTTTLHGDVTVTGNTSASLYGSGSCYTYGGFDDIASGATVTVRDSGDAIVAIGSLDAGSSEDGSCVFDFTVPDVPESSFYSVEVSKRGPLTYSADDVENGTIHQSLSSW